MIYVRHRQSSDADQENRIGGRERRSGADPDAAFDLHRRHLRGLSDRCVADPRDQGKFPLILTAVVFRGRHYPWRGPLVRSSNRFLYSAAVISVGVLLLACDYFVRLFIHCLEGLLLPAHAGRIRMFGARRLPNSLHAISTGTLYRRPDRGPGMESWRQANI